MHPEALILLPMARQEELHMTLKVKKKMKSRSITSMIMMRKRMTDGKNLKIGEGRGEKCKKCLRTRMTKRCALCGFGLRGQGDPFACMFTILDLKSLLEGIALHGIVVSNDLIHV